MVQNVSRTALFHCGLSKTGTTSMQRHIYPEISRINDLIYLGKTYTQPVKFPENTKTQVNWSLQKFVFMNGPFPHNPMRFTETLTDLIIHSERLKSKRQHYLNHASAQRQHYLNHASAPGMTENKTGPQLLLGKWIYSDEGVTSWKSKFNSIETVYNIFLALNNILQMECLVSIREISSMVISLYKHHAMEDLVMKKTALKFQDYCKEIELPKPDGSINFYRFLIGAPEYQIFYEKIPMTYFDSFAILKSQNNLDQFCANFNLKSPRLCYPLPKENVNEDNRYQEFFDEQRDDFKFFIEKCPKLNEIFEKKGIFYYRR